MLRLYTLRAYFRLPNAYLKYETQASYCVIERAIEVFYVQKFNRASICLGHADVRLCSAVDHGARPGVWRLAKGCVQDQTKSEVGRIWLSRPTST